MRQYLSLIIGSLSVLVLANSCAKHPEVKSQRVGPIPTLFAPAVQESQAPVSPPIRTKEGLAQLTALVTLAAAPRGMRDLGDVLVRWKKPQKPPEPIPGRLLVKIDPFEIAQSFRPTRSICRIESLIHEGVLPKDLGIVNVAYQGLTQHGKAALAVKLERPSEFKTLRKAFAETKAQPIAEDMARIRKKPADRILVTIDLKDLKPGWFKLCQPDYFYLKEESVLRQVFKKMDVLSMRRVFRSLEKPDRERPGYFRVRRFKDALAEAKRRNPQRTARAYPDVSVADNMENWFLLQLVQANRLDRAIDELQGKRGIQNVSADYPVVAATNDPEYADQWGLNNTGTFRGNTGGVPGFDIDIELAWSAVSASQPIIVAVLDTGFNENLDELLNRMWTNTGEVPGDNQDNDCNGYVDDVHGIITYDRWEIDYSAFPACSASPGSPSAPLNFHGTVVGGVIAAETENGVGIAGVAGTDNVQLMNVAIGWCSTAARFGTGSAELAEGLWYAISPTCLDTPQAQCPSPSTPVQGADVANMSVYSRGLPVMFEETVHAALDAGLVLVASAGNDGLRYTKAEGYQSFGVFPASMRGVIAVGGSTRGERRWSSSNYGPGLDLVAPASEVLTLSFDESNPGQSIVMPLSGTSLSSAFVSGAAAVILGRYPNTTAPYMRNWLRATARDMTDPEGVGANLVGEDEWTGAGMLNAGIATVVLANPDDQPLEVDILVERLTIRAPSHFSDWSPDAVAGSPDLGITVNGIGCVPGQTTQPASCPVASWRLEYGLSDAPQIWFPVIIPDSNTDTPINEITTNPVDVLRSGSTYYRHTEVAPGHNHLNTDLLVNKSLYKVRLVAENKAGRVFTADDWVIPTRAEIRLPSHNTTIVGRWGWAPIKGFTDIRPGASYTIALKYEMWGLLWNSLPFVPAERYNALISAGSASSYTQQLSQRWGASASAFMDLMLQFNNRNVQGWVAQFPQVDLSQIPEEWVSYTLYTQTATGAVETDTVRLYLDNSHFPYETNWPVQIPTNHLSVTQSESHSERLSITDMGPGVGPRIFVIKQGQLVCMDGNGAIVGSLPSALSYVAVEDVDNDGIKEILTSEISVSTPGGGYYSPGSGPPTITGSLHLWQADCQTPYSGWPAVEYAFTSTDTDGWHQFSAKIGRLRIADVTGDADKEIIFYRRPNNYYSIPVQDITMGHLHVLDKAGNDLWRKEFTEDQRSLRFQIGDVDDDGKDDILLETQGQIIGGDGNFKSGWDTPGNYDGARFLQRGASSKLHVVLYKSSIRSGSNYEITVKGDDGNTLSGWPLNYPSDVVEVPTDPQSRMAILQVLPGQVVAGGDEELILCENKLRVYNTAGQAVGTFPEIDLQGACSGLDLLDVDNDGALEIVVLVNRFKRDVPAILRRGSFVEAYELDGTRLADSDNRWPIVVAISLWNFSGPRAPVLGGRISFGNTDGDPWPEAVQLMEIPPYAGELRSQGPRAQIEVLNLQ